MMGTSNLDRLIVSYPHSSKSSSSQETLKIKVPSSAKEFKVGDDVGNPMTPSSVEHIISVMEACPPAPRKVKRARSTGKQQMCCFPVVRGPDEFMVYMDAMLALNETVYVPDIVVGDLFGAGDHVKRLRLLPPPAHEL